MFVLFIAGRTFGRRDPDASRQAKAEAGARMLGIRNATSKVKSTSSLQASLPPRPLLRRREFAI